MLKNIIKSILVAVVIVIALIFLYETNFGIYLRDMRVEDVKWEDRVKEQENPNNSNVIMFSQSSAYFSNLHVEGSYK